MRRDRQVKFWVNENEFKAIKASAEVNAVSVSEYCRNCSVGRPVKARNRLFRAERQLQRQRLAEQEAEEQAKAGIISPEELAEIHAMEREQWEAESKRQPKAPEISPAQPKPPQPRPMPAAARSEPKPAPAWQPPPAPTGILDLDSPVLDLLGPPDYGHKARIVRREPERRQTDRGVDGAAGFDE
jgi:hypothetical protein